LGYNAGSGGPLALAQRRLSAPPVTHHQTAKMAAMPSPPSHRLHAQRVVTATLAAPLRAAMFQLYAHYYGAAEFERFVADLLEKDEALLLFDGEGEVRGFTTLKLLTLTDQQPPLRALFSGDTIIHHHYWGEQQLAFSWIRRAGELKAQAPHLPLYWFLIVKGHRTYRYLQAFSRHYYPHPHQPTPPPLQALMDRLATDRFGRHYDPASGLIRFPTSQGHLQPEWAEADPVALARPEVRYFYQRNPGHQQGHELVCLTELHPDNLRPLARRLFLQGLAQ